MPSPLVEAWAMSNEANLYLLKQIPPACLKDTYAPPTRNVAQQFAHMHGVRVRWMQHAAPDLVGGLKTFPRGSAPTRKQLSDALRASEKMIARYLERCEETGRVNQWKGSPTTYLSYLVAHEAHHRGLAMVAMRMNGRKLPKATVYGQWQWGKKYNER